VSVTTNSRTFGIEGTETITYTHSGAATGIVIYCTANGYLTEVAVSKLNLTATALSDELKNATKTGEVRAIRITPTEKDVMQNEITTLIATPFTSYGATAGTITWKSDNTSVATVNANGQVTAVASSGTATITATCNGHSASSVITATAAESWQAIASKNYTWDDADTVAAKDNINLNNRTGFWGYMYIDATGGKFASNGGSWIDCQNTTIYIPMTKNGTITIKLYQADQYKSVTGGSTTLTENAGNKEYVYSYQVADVVTGATLKNGTSIDGIEDNYTYAKIVFANEGGSKYIGDIIRSY
ncbi:MAG: Ig-like domain-containing protein, partial [Treponemataceae bacterium]|nr:Ig-like domain-containing protein [Treponemataceae bacterium]